MNSTMPYRYEHNRNTHYLVVDVEDEETVFGFEMKMLQELDCKGVLRAVVRHRDEGAELLYEISCKNTLDTVLKDKKTGIDEVKNLFIQLNGAAAELENYLLKADHLLLNPMYIYCDDDGRIYFCYLPAKGNSLQNSLKELVEFLLKRIDHKDAEAVKTVYGMHQICQNEYFGLGDLMDLFCSFEEDTLPEEETAPMIYPEAGADQRGAGSVWESIRYQVAKVFRGATDAELAPHSGKRMVQARLLSKDPKQYPDIYMEEFPFRIGKAQDAGGENPDFFQRFPTVSRHHAEISYEYGEFCLHELGSTNGTKVNGKRLANGDTVRLRDVDCIVVAELEFIFEEI